MNIEIRKKKANQQRSRNFQVALERARQTRMKEKKGGVIPEAAASEGPIPGEKVAARVDAIILREVRRQRMEGMASATPS